MQQCHIHKKRFTFSTSINSSYRLKVISRGCVWIELLKFRSFVALCIIRLCVRVILLFPFVFSLNAFQIFTTLEPSKQSRKTRFEVFSFMWFFFYYYFWMCMELDVHGTECAWKWLLSHWMCSFCPACSLISVSPA